MNDTDFETRLERVRRAAEVIETLPERLQDQAFQYLVGEARSAGTPTSPRAAAATPEVEAPALPNGGTAEETGTSNGNGNSRKGRRAASKGNKSAPQDRDIDLFPADKPSFKDFAVEKAPKTNDEKYAVAVYWILRVAELPAATVAQVVSCYLAADWALPSQVANAASQSRKAGYLSSAKAEDLQLTSIGINLVNKVLPRPSSSA